MRLGAHEVNDPTIVLLVWAGTLLAILTACRVISMIVLRVRWRRLWNRQKKGYRATQQAVQGRLFADLDPRLNNIDWDGFTKQMETLIKPE